MLCAGSVSPPLFPFGSNSCAGETMGSADLPADDHPSANELREKWDEIMRRASEETNPARLLELSRELYQSMLEEDQRIARTKILRKREEV
jgi:hypothetical protein